MERIILKEKNFNRLRELVKKNSDKEIIFTSPENDDDLNRKVLEKLPIKIIIINESERKDFQKQRNSGFNQVLGKIAKKNSITIGINLDEILNNKISPKEKSRILARVKQNIEICKKNKLKMKFISEKNSKHSLSLKSLGLVLGMPTQMVKNL